MSTPVRGGSIATPMPGRESSVQSSIREPSITGNSIKTKTAIALYDYDPTEEGELAIRENDQLFVLEDTDPDWWLVKFVSSQHEGQGLVPKTYVKVQDAQMDAETIKMERLRQDQEIRHQQEMEKHQEQLKRLGQQEMDQRRHQEELEMERRHQEELEMERRRQQEIKEQERRNEEAPKVPVIPSRPVFAFYVRLCQTDKQHPR